MARKTLVLDLEIQPVVEDLEDTHSEAVYLVNSEKLRRRRISRGRTARTRPPFRSLTEEIARFQSDTIANLQEQSRSLRAELDSAKVLGGEAWSQSTDLKALDQSHLQWIPPRSSGDVGPRRDRRHGGRRGGLGGDGRGGVTDASGNLRGGRSRGGPDPPLARLPSAGDGSRAGSSASRSVPTGSTPARPPRSPPPTPSRSSSSPSPTVPWRTGP